MITSVAINGATIDPCHILAQATVLHGRQQFGDPGQASSAQIVVEYQQGPMPAWQSGDTLTLDTPEGVIFSGRIVERSLTHLTNNDGTRTGQFTITAAGPLAALGIRMVGDVPWPQEAGTTRADKILAAAAVPYRIEGSPELQVLARDMDAQPALGLLDELAESTGATVFDTPDGHVVYQTMQERSRPVEPFMWDDFPTPPGDTWDDFHPDLTWAGETFNVLWPEQASATEDGTLTGFTQGLGYGQGTPTSVAGGAHGARSVRYVNTVADGFIAVCDTAPAALSGETVTATCSVLLEVTGGACQPAVLFFDWLGTQLGGWHFGPTLTVGPNVWTDLPPYTLTAPAGTAYVSVGAYLPWGTVGRAARLDKLGAWRGTGGAWAMPGEPIDLPGGSIDDWPSPTSTFPVVLPSCAVVWEPEWHSSEGAVINHVRIGYGAAEPQAYVDLTDAASITQHGARYLYQGTQLATVTDANVRASHIITTQAVERWEIGDVVVALDQLDDPATYSAVFNLLCGDPVTLQGMPQPAPGTDWTGILEGWTYTMDGAGGALTEQMVLALSDPAQSMMVMTWADYPTTYTWGQHPAHLTWFDLDSIDVMEAV